jgi:uridine kinase
MGKVVSKLSIAIPRHFLWFVLFWIGSRAVMIGFFGSVPASLFEKLYGPFIENFIISPSIDPWTDWLASSGSSEAFPYGWPTLLTFAVGQVIGASFGSTWFGFLAILLICDFSAFLLLITSEVNLQERFSFIVGAYLISPLPALSMLIEGSTDFIPMLLVAMAFAALVAKRPAWAGAMLGLAVGSKLILAISLVGALLFLVRSRSSKTDALVFVAFLGTTIGISISPLFYSLGFRESLATSDDATGPLSWGIPSSSGTLLLLPLVVFSVWYAVYQLGRMNSNLLALALATPLLVTSSLPGAPIGWSLWALPLVIYLAAPLAWRFRALAVLAINSTSLSYLFSLLASNYGYPISDIQNGLLLTSNLAISVVTAVLFWREHYTRSDFVRLRSRPALVLISGDSGVGKDTLAVGLANILGKDSTVHVSGDDYHRWDRGNGSWQHLTHLNPNANELTKFFNDILTLTDGGDIRSGKYDHRVGRRLSSYTARGREFVLASGLHSLMVSDMNRQASLTVYLEMSEDLRATLKIKRDSHSRGHKPADVLKSIDARKYDFLKYIEPQRSLANLVVKTSAIGQIDSTGSSEIEVSFESEAKIFDSMLLSELSMTCGLEVTTENIDRNRRKISVRGSASSEDLSAAFVKLEPRISDILGEPVTWSVGPAGLVQMVVMVYLGNALRRERLVK